jgi:hypothetical protein
MKKSKLTSLISKYSLGGNIESVVWTTKSGNTTVEMVHPTQTLIGSVKLKDSDIPDSRLGIYDTSRLSQMLGGLSEDFDMDINEQNGKPVAIQMKDKTFKMKFVPADVDIIPKAAKIKQLPEFEMRIKLDDEFIDSYIKATKAVSEPVTAFEGDSDITVTIGYSDTTNINNVKFQVENKADESNDSFIATFNTDFLKDVLTANKGLPGVMDISSKGLSRLMFKNEDFDNTYYLVQTSVD